MYTPHLCARVIVRLIIERFTVVILTEGETIGQQADKSISAEQSEEKPWAHHNNS